MKEASRERHLYQRWTLSHRESSGLASRLPPLCEVPQARTPAWSCPSSPGPSSPIGNVSHLWHLGKQPILKHVKVFQYGKCTNNVSHSGPGVRAAALTERPWPFLEPVHKRRPQQAPEPEGRGKSGGVGEPCPGLTSLLSAQLWWPASGVPFEHPFQPHQPCAQPACAQKP